MHKSWILVTGPGWDGLVQQLKDEGHSVIVYTNKDEWEDYPHGLPVRKPWVLFHVHNPSYSIVNPFTNIIYCYSTPSTSSRATGLTPLADLWGGAPMLIVELPPL